MLEGVCGLEVIFFNDKIPLLECHICQYIYVMLFFGGCLVLCFCKDCGLVR